MLKTGWNVFFPGSRPVRCYKKDDLRLASGGYHGHNTLAINGYVYVCRGQYLSLHKTNSGDHLKNWIIAGILTILLFTFLGFRQLYSSNMNYRHAWERTAAAKAKQHYQIENIRSVSYYHGTDAYHVVKGSRNGAVMYVWVPDKPKRASYIIREAEKGISQQEALQKLAALHLDIKEVLSVRLGAIHGVPVWTVTFLNGTDHYNYVSFYFDDGKEAQRILNV